jgi:CTP synthase
MKKPDSVVTKYIFVSGGVLSGLGKGVVAAAVSTLIKNRGYSVRILKCENYLNIDSGTINPIEHGDPFLCEDGLEADMDLGTYERFLNQDMGKENFTTMGQIYKSVIDRERNFGYDGEDVEAIPHISNEIISRVEAAGKGADFVIIELGGTAGEYQNMLYYEACRIMKTKLKKRVINVHVSYIPVPSHIGEPKTMPTQMSVRTLMSMGIQPEFLVLRSKATLDKRRRYLLGLKTSVEGENVIMAPDVDIIYKTPIFFYEQEFDKKILEYFDLPVKKAGVKKWQDLIDKIHAPKKKVATIAIVGKYFSKSKGDYQLLDAYAALIEALKHACWSQNIQLELNCINSELLEEQGTDLLKGSTGIVVPIGWGNRGVEGKIQAITYARTKKIPYLGLCYGMQLAAVEFAKNVCGLLDANTTEIDPNTSNPIIHDIPLEARYQVIKGDGVSMRLGAYDCIIKKGTLAEKIYDKHNAWVNKGKRLVSERHRHRYEFNNEYRKILSDKGFVISGTSPDDFFVEVIELSRNLHPFFIATQAHPEYKSRPLQPHPLFLEFIKVSAH